MLRWANSPTAPFRVEGRNQGSFLLVFPRTLYASRCGYLAGGVAGRWACACILRYSARIVLLLAL
jgi:hypothetical protein